MAAQRRVPLWRTALSGLLALLFLCAPARAATDFSYGAQARAAAGPGDIVLLYTGPSETEAEAKAAKLIAESITPAYVAYEAARKWDGKAPTHILGDAAIPFLNVDAPTKTDENRPTNGESRDENY